MNLKRALLIPRRLYRKWIRYINSPASTKKPGMTEYILLVAVSAAIVIKFKGTIEERLFKENSYYQYYDRVEPNLRSHPYIE